MATLLIIIAIIAIIIAVAKSSKQAQPQQDGISSSSDSIRIEVTGNAPIGGYRLRDYVGESQKIPSRNWAQIEWFGKYEKLTLGLYEIEKPFVYSSAGALKESESSCIDRILLVGNLVSEPRGALGYWPTYERISPDQRANYLQWLQTGKCAPLDDAGYIFLYFYGLERRALLEKKDQALILDEIIRLTDIYRFSGSLNSYSASFAAYLVALPENRSQVEPFIGSLMKLAKSGNNSDLLAALLHYYHEAGRPLPATMAQLVAEMDPLAGRSSIPQRFPVKFAQLFESKYYGRYLEGLVPTPSKGVRVIDHTLASGTLSNELGAHVSKTHIPDLLGISSQYKHLLDIYYLCIEELRPLGRKVNAGYSVDSREVYAALPHALRKKADHPDEPKWRAITEVKRTDDGFAIVEVGELARLLDIDERDKLTLKQTRDIAETAQQVGYVIEPDGRILNTAYEWDSLVALFHDEDVLQAPIDSCFIAACVVLQLGLWIATADGKADEQELRVLSSFIKEIFTLAPHECKRLEIQKKVLLLKPSGKPNLGKRLQEALSTEQRQQLGKLLVAVAAATSGIDDSEWKALRQTYRTLGLSANQFDETIESFQPSNSELGLVREGTPGEPGEKLPPRNIVQEAPIVELSAEKLREVLENTREVTAILSSVFVDESIPPCEPVQIETVQHEGKYTGLQDRYHTLLDIIISRDEWTDRDFEELMKKHDSMRLDVIEQINIWADDVLGDFLIKEEDGVVRVETNLWENIS